MHLNGKFHFSSIADYFSRVSRENMAVFFRQFHVLIGSGVGITRSLDIACQQAPHKKLKEALSEILKNVDNGFPISRAMQKTKKAFSPIHVQMIKAAEGSGTLHRILGHIAQYEERELYFRRKVIAALTYPAVIFALSGIVVFILLRFVLPNILNIIRQMSNAEFSLPTRALLSLSAFVASPWSLFIFIFSFALAYYLLKIYMETPLGKFQYDQYKFKIPVLGPFLQKIMIIRICIMLETLYAAGVMALDALRITGETTNNEFVKEKIIKVIAENLEAGEGISAAIKKTENFPPVVTGMVTVGEETGRLGLMLSKASEIYKLEVECSLQKFNALLEPVMIAVLGTFTCFILLAAMMPIYQLINCIK